MRKTKIVCTIGPASDTEETFAAMCRAGLNVARLNFSHGTHEEHQKKIDMIKKIREKLGLPIRFVGVGEKIDDLIFFSATDFAEALLPEVPQHKKEETEQAGEEQA